MYIQIKPMGKPRMTQRDRWANRPVVQRYYAYCDELRQKYPGDLPTQLYVTFYIEMPKSWSAKKKDKMVGEPHQQKPDIDNLCKAFMDALSDDDSHVYILHAEKYWCYECPGIDFREEML